MAQQQRYSFRGESTIWVMALCSPFGPLKKSMVHVPRFYDKKIAARLSRLLVFFGNIFTHFRILINLANKSRKFTHQGEYFLSFLFRMIQLLKMEIHLRFQISKNSTGIWEIWLIIKLMRLIKN